MTVHKLDASGLLCPMPVIRTQNRIEELHAGDILEVECTDPGAANDIPAWCRINGHKLVGIQHYKNHLTVVIEVNKT